MELLKFFLTDTVESVGISQYMDKKDERKAYIDQIYNPQKQYFKPDYSNNFFLL